MLVKLNLSNHTVMCRAVRNYQSSIRVYGYVVYVGSNFIIFTNVFRISLESRLSGHSLVSGRHVLGRRYPDPRGSAVLLDKKPYIRRHLSVSTYHSYV